MNQHQTLIYKIFVLILTILLMIGCATQISKPTREPLPSKVRFGEFTNIEMKAVGISETYAEAEANQKALRKIDEILFNDMRMLYPNLKRIENGEDFSKASDKTLQITPIIKEIKFVGGGARFWVGAMAGSSAVLMEAIFRDGSSSEIIADPEFIRVANAYSGGWSMGVTDNKMLEDIARDIVNYASVNK